LKNSGNKKQSKALYSSARFEDTRSVPAREKQALASFEAARFRC
jgi:hypothetical protein